MTRIRSKKVAKNELARTGFNSHGTDVIKDLKNEDENIKTKTKFEKNERKVKAFGKDSTLFKVRKLSQFWKRSALAGSEGIEETFAHKTRKRHPRSLGIPSSGNGGDFSPDKDNNSCLRNKNFTLSCYGRLSCRNRCQHPRTVLYQAKLSCFCDEDCEFFQDCCADFDDFCGGNLPNGTYINNTTSGPYKTQHTSPADNLVNEQNRYLWSCYGGKDLDVRGTNGIWMIGSCPSSWPQDDILYRCRNLSQTNKITIDNYRYLPVYTSNGRVYHNRFCAQCNVSTKYFSSFPLSVECNFSPPNHLSLQGKMQFLFRYCSERIKWKGSGDHPRRYCIDFKENNAPLAIDSENVEGKNKCQKGKTRVVTSSKGHFKNLDCAKYLRELCFSCGPNISEIGQNANGPSPPKPLSLLFNFYPTRSSLNIKTQCEDNKVYDHYLEICREGISPGLMVGNSYVNQHLVVLWVQLPKGKTILQTPAALDLITKTLGISQQKVSSLSVEDFENTTEIRKRNRKLQFNLEITQNERSLSNIKRILDFTSPFNITIVGQVFTVIKATNRILSCANRQKYDRSEYTVLQGGTSAVFIKTTGEVVHYTEYYINTTEESTSANDSQAIFVCRQQQTSNCSGVYILMKEGEFRVLRNKSIFVNASRQVYNFSEYTWINKSILVCYYTSNDYPWPLLTTISIVCMSLSIIGLVFVLVTYSLFSELRTPPGINLMNLSVSLLLAQLLWLFGSGQTDTPMACTVIAVILHYLFLVSFMWTSIIAFDTWRAFSAKGRRPLADSRPERIKHCLRHMTVGWLPVMVYVAICVAMDLTNTVNIKYMSKTACWMGNQWAKLYLFAIPVGLFLIFNIVFFIKTYKAIKVTTAQARAATNNNNTKKSFGIYVRIASLMGFTWILGFVAPFGWQFLWYPFVILNGLQGVYIALAFPLNKRARNLYKGLLTSKSSQETTAKSPQDTTVKSPQDTTVKSPQDTTAKSPQDTTDKSPQDTTDKSPQDTTDKSPQDTTVKSPQDTTVKSPQDTTVKSPQDTTVKYPQDTSVKYPQDTTVKSCQDTTGCCQDILVKSSQDTAVKSSRGSTKTQGERKEYSF